MTISLRLAGGLGNQIFQYGFASLAAENLGGNIVIDERFLGSYATPRHSCLTNIFNIKLNYVSSCILKYRIPRVFPGFYICKHLISDKNCNEFLSLNGYKRAYLDGYFSSNLTAKNLNDVVAVVSALPLNAAKREDSNKCVIHIRGGDYLREGWVGQNDERYYARAVEFIKREFDAKVFEVVTDDPVYAKIIMSRLSLDCFVYSESLESDFSRLFSSRYVISSGSTFSFWAGAINQKKSVMVSPKTWMGGVARKGEIDREILI